MYHGLYRVLSYWYLLCSRKANFCYNKVSVFCMFWSLIKGITPKIRILYFVLINRELFCLTSTETRLFIRDGDNIIVLLDVHKTRLFIRDGDNIIVLLDVHRNETVY